MQQQPEISPDGRYWWNGHAWQPMAAGAPPPVVPAPPVAPTAPGPAPAPDLSRPTWLADGVALPSPPGAVPPPTAAPAAYVEETPLWMGPQPKRHTVTTIALWFGVILGGVVLLFGVLGIFGAQSAPLERQQAELTGALIVTAIGAVVFVPSLLNVTGFGGILGASTGAFGGVLNELGVVGTVVTVLMIIGTIVILTSPVGTARYGVPLAGVVMIVRRAYQGRWVAAGTITAVWMFGAIAALATGH